MESNDQFSQELPSELSQIAASEPENSTNQELDELELDAIAGGYHIYTATNGADWQEPKSKADLNKTFFNRFNPNAW
ncbi:MULTISPECIES: hypothetical protein [unclassified Microcoleus]|uniref:hypothetical protein n=1 Tax=unclassified Microcoleus TaxID=2642155 RepID=UPI002FCE72F7